MKKILAIIFFFVFIVNCFPQAKNDKLMNERNELYQKYAELVNPEKKPSNKESQAMVSALKEVVIKDTEIISKLQDSDKKLKEANTRLDSLNKKVTVLAADSKSQSSERMIYYIVGAGLFVLSMLFMILMFVFLNKYKKTKGVTIPEDMNDLIAGLHQERSALEKKLNELEEKNASQSDQSYEAADLKIGIVEKLFRLKEIGAITIEEFTIYKQNFLGDL